MPQLVEVFCYSFDKIILSERLGLIIKNILNMLIKIQNPIDKWGFDRFLGIVLNELLNQFPLTMHSTDNSGKVVVL